MTQQYKLVQGDVKDYIMFSKEWAINVRQTFIDTVSMWDVKVAGFDTIIVYYSHCGS